MLHTSQPSLSRQIRDLESEVGVATAEAPRSRYRTDTPAGRAFLDHARSVLSQVEAATEAARRVAHPAKPCFSMGFLTGHELTWMPEALRILRDELPNIDVMISSQYSPQLAVAYRREPSVQVFFDANKGCQSLAFRPLVKEPLVVVLPMATVWLSVKAIGPGDLSGRDIRGRVAHGSCASCGHRRLLEAVRSQYHARSRDGARRHGNVA